MIDLGDLRRKVEREIDEYVYEHANHALGIPLSPDWIATRLQDMRRALLPLPIWIDLTILDLVSRTSTLRSCLLIAEEGAGYGVAYDVADDDFRMTYRRADKYASWTGAGSAVACFLEI